MSNGDRTPDNPYDEHTFKTTPALPGHTNYYDPVSGTYIHVSFSFSSLHEKPPPSEYLSTIIMKTKPKEQAKAKGAEDRPKSPRHQRQRPSTRTERTAPTTQKVMRR